MTIDESEMRLDYWTKRRIRNDTRGGWPLIDMSDGLQTMKRVGLALFR